MYKLFGKEPMTNDSSFIFNRETNMTNESRNKNPQLKYSLLPYYRIKYLNKTRYYHLIIQLHKENGSFCDKNSYRQTSLAVSTSYFDKKK